LQRFHNANEGYTLPVPANFAIDQEGTIVYAFKDVDYTKRAKIEDSLESLKPSASSFLGSL